MFEGNEVEGKIGEDGSYFLDVDAKGKVKAGINYKKNIGELASISTSNALETDIFAIARMVVKKTGATWDDTLEAALEKLLGIEADESTVMTTQP